MREIEVIELLHQGLRNTEIAQRLSISYRTVESHVRSIITKLGVQSRGEAVRVAEERNLLGTQAMQSYFAPFEERAEARSTRYSPQAGSGTCRCNLSYQGHRHR